jgi:NitT/TauT family transport system ATP-binding protein
MSVAIEIAGISKSYSLPKGEIRALGPVDLSIPAGKFVSLVGPSGCGKSTLLMIIAGLVPATQGTVTIAGRPVASPVTDLGIVFQSCVLVDWRSAVDNVLLQIELRGLPRKQYQPKAEALLRSVGLGGFLDRRPYELSGGMQQRTAFCRALIHDPPLMLLDEPLGALDAMTGEQLRGDLEALWMQRSMTVVLVTHSIEEAVQLSDEVMVISPRPGRIVRRVLVDLPRPRDFALRQHAAFSEHVTEIKEIFRGYGVL